MLLRVESVQKLIYEMGLCFFEALQLHLKGGNAKFGIIGPITVSCCALH